MSIDQPSIRWRWLGAWSLTLILALVIGATNSGIAGAQVWSGETRFQGTALYQSANMGAAWWSVSIDHVISGAIGPGITEVNVFTGGGVLQYGYVDPDIREGDLVEVSGEYHCSATADPSCYVTLPETRHYIKKVGSAENQCPVTAFDASPTTGTAPLTVTFSDRSYDPDGTIATRLWDFGDNWFCPNNETVTHVYTTPGTFDACLYISDDDGCGRSACVQIRVSGGPPHEECSTHVKGRVVSSPVIDYAPDSGHFMLQITDVLRDDSGAVFVGQTIEVRVTVQAASVLSQIGQGDCVEVCGVWDTQIYCGETGYVRKTQCSAEALGCIDGWVRDAESQAGISGARVELVSGPSSGSTTSDSNGYFKLCNLKPGDYRVGALKDGYNLVALSYPHVVGGSPCDRCSRADLSMSRVEQGRPDLVVTQITCAPAQPTVGSRVTLSAVVRNAGTAAAGSFSTSFSADGALLGTQDSSGLAAGATAVLALVGWGGMPTWTWLNNCARDHRLVAVADSGNQVAETNENNNEGSQSVRVQCLAGMIRDWLIIGPFTYSSSEGQKALDTDFVQGEGTISPELGTTSGGKQWRENHDLDDYVDFDGLFSPNDNVVAYACVYVNSPREQVVQLRIGSDDAVKVWLDGTVVHENYIERAALPDQDVKSVTLKSGWNRCLVKVLEHYGGWGFYARLTDAAGNAVPGLTYSLSPPAGELPDLIVASLKVSPEDPTRETVLKVEVRVTNQGKEATSAFSVGLYADEAPIGSQRVVSLAPGATFVATFTGDKSSWTWMKRCDARHTLKAAADSSAEVRESNEDNNAASVGLMVHCVETEGSCIRDWLIAGPYTFSAGNERTAHNTDYVGETTAQVVLGMDAGGKVWTAHHDGDDYIDLGLILKPNTHVTAYACVYVCSTTQQQAYLRVGSSDAIKVWLNAALVHDKFVSRQAVKDEDVITIALVSGWNSLLIKVTEISSEWGLYARITDRDGGPLEGLVLEPALVQVRRLPIDSRPSDPPLVVKVEPEKGKSPLHATVIIENRKETWYELSVEDPQGNVTPWLLPPKASGVWAYQESVTFDLGRGEVTVDIKATRDSWQARLVNLVDAVFMGIPGVGGDHLNNLAMSYVLDGAVTAVGGEGGDVVQALADGDWLGALLAFADCLKDEYTAMRVLEALKLDISNVPAVVKYAQAIDLAKRLWIMANTLWDTFTAPMIDQEILYAAKVETRYAPPSIEISMPNAGETLPTGDVLVMGTISSGFDRAEHPLRARLSVDGKEEPGELSVSTSGVFSETLKLPNGIHVAGVAAENDGLGNPASRFVPFLVGYEDTGSGCIMGRVATDTGLPVHGVRVIAFGSLGTGGNTTNSSGIYRIANLQIGTGYTVAVLTAPGYEIPSQKANISVSKGTCATQDFTLYKPGGGKKEGCISGAVLTSNRTGMGGVTVDVRGPIGTQSQTGPDGHFRFDDLPVGTYSVGITDVDGYEHVSRRDGITVGEGDCARVDFTLTESVAKLPDLRVSIVKLEPSAICPGTLVKVTYSITNAGKRQSRKCTVGFYLGGSRGDTTTIPIQQPNVEELLPGATEQATTNIPTASTARLAPGTYFLTALVDSTGKVDEGNEENNRDSKSVRVTTCSGPKAMVIHGSDQVDLVVTDPDGLVICSNATSVPGSSYEKVDIDGDGRLDVEILIPERKEGDYDVRVVPEPGAEPDGTYSVTVTSHGHSTSLAVDVSIGEIPDEPYSYSGQVQPLNFAKGLNMIAVSVLPEDPSPEAVFGGVSGRPDVRHWDSSGRLWTSVGNGRLNAIAPMEGYWIWADGEVTVDIVGTPLEGDQALTLGGKGWQQIGTPYEVAWGASGGGTIRVERAGKTESLAKAVALGWIAGTAWSWDGSAQEWVTLTGSAGATLMPWVGYWVYTYVGDLVLRFSEEPGGSEIVPEGLQPRGEPPSMGTNGANGEAVQALSTLQVISVPNPAKDEAVFEVKGVSTLRVDGLEITIYDLSGHKVWYGRSTSAELPWDTNDTWGNPLANGMYLAVIHVRVDGQWVSAPVWKIAILR